MANIQLNKLTNCNLYINGTTFIGRAEEIQLPTIKHKMADHKALGLMGEVELWTGGIEKMESKIKWGSFYRDAFLLNADPTVTNSLQIRGNLMTSDSQGIASQSAYVCYMSAIFKDFPLGNFKHLDNVELETNLSVYYVKLEVGGEELMQIDVLANIYKVGGVDKLAAYRANVGA